MPLRYSEFKTSLGRIVAVSDEVGLVSLSFKGQADETPLPKDAKRDDAHFQELAAAIQRYADGKGPLPKIRFGKIKATAFQQRVWRELEAIPHGHMKTYGDIARQLGKPQAMRAVGGACGRNPVPLFVPCHRVLAASQKLGGFSAGLDVKRRLLQIEGIAYREG
jgi:methylated-DNA-[protein]-cysteine S-methyltransferase